MLKFEFSHEDRVTRRHGERGGAPCYALFLSVSVVKCFSESLKCLLYVLHRITQDDWTTVGAGHWAFGLSQFSKEPLHLVLLERHVDLDSGMARNRCCNAM